MKKRVVCVFLLTSCFLGVAVIHRLSFLKQAIAQTQIDEELYYIYDGQKKLLTLRQDFVAVEGTPISQIEGVEGTPTLQIEGVERTPTLQVEGNETNEPLYIRIRKALSDLRAVDTPSVNPLGERHVLLSIPTQISNLPIQRKLQELREKKEIVENILPVLSLRGGDEVMVLPNEIIVRFQSGVTGTQREVIADEHGLEIAGLLPLSKDRYLLQLKNTSATEIIEILKIANQLSNLPEVKFATPNFIRSAQRVNPTPTTGNWSLPQLIDPNKELKQKQDSQKLLQSPFFLQWHLYSKPLQICWQGLQTDSQPSLGKLLACNNSTSRLKSLSPRTDLRAKEAWQYTNGNGEVVVAVIDTVFQLDHPELKDSWHVVDIPNKCEGEVHGWDLSQLTQLTQDICAIGDHNPGLDDQELEITREVFEDSFKQKQSDTNLIQKYVQNYQIQAIQKNNPHLTPEQLEQGLASKLRRTFLGNITGQIFHGTAVSGVIAARPQNRALTVVGVAPNSKILPVRVFQITNPSSLRDAFGDNIEQPVIFASDAAVGVAISYAANRGADIINLSLIMGQSDEVKDRIQEALADKPNLVIFASSGNYATNRVKFPASLDGVVAVGATNLNGNRAPYSEFGQKLSLVAPGGDLFSHQLPNSSQLALGGILTTGGTWGDYFWQNLKIPDFRKEPRWGRVLDPRGGYLWTNGTSFSSPAVAGVLAMMKGEDPDNRLNRKQLMEILQGTASYEGLQLTSNECNFYRSQVKNGNLPASISAEQYFFGSGLVNAQTAVKTVQDVLEGELELPLESKQVSSLCLPASN